MNTNKIVIGTLVGGVVFFLLGFLIYGLLLADFMAANSNPCVMLKMEEMIWWALIASNLVMAFFLSLIFSWTGTNTIGGGMGKGAMVGFITGLGFDLGMYATSTMMNSPGAIMADVAASAVMCAVTGAAIGMVMGMGKKAAA